MKKLHLSCLILALTISNLEGQGAYLEVVGIAQDAGYPQINCKKNCCSQAWLDQTKEVYVACVAVVLPSEKSYYLIDATPDMKHQMHMVESRTGYTLGGIFLTHAHMGHYTGLMDLGREAMGANSVHVYAMPRMDSFLVKNGPWSQLVRLNNIEIQPMSHLKPITIGEIRITPHLVPHRDEYSETVGFLIEGNTSSVWYIPDINKWHLWSEKLEDHLKHDHLLIDGTFYQNGEIWGRDMSEIPHPFITETMALLDGYSDELKEKIIFTHFNHTNPALWDDRVRLEIRQQGFQLAHQGQQIRL